MRYEFWKKIISRARLFACERYSSHPTREQDEALGGRILPKVYNVALYSTWEAQ
jgi:hypothetical protein